MIAGFARETVNPPLGMPMEGLGQQNGIQRIRDDLFVRALYLQDGAERLLILGYDLLFFERSHVDWIKGAVGRVLDLTPRQILLNTSHNHAGPRMTRWHYSGAPDLAYLEQIVAATVSAAQAAQATAEPASMAAGMTETDFPVSRRRPDEAGQAQWAPYPEGEVCRALPVCRIGNEAGKVIALLFSVSCHPSMIYECVATAEYPGETTRRLNEHFGTEGAFFLQGCGGDSKPKPVARDRWVSGTWDQLEAAGRELAETVIACVEAGLQPVKPALRLHLQDVDWPLEPAPDKAELETIANAPEGGDRRTWAADMLDRLDRYGELPAAIPVATHLVQLGTGLRLVALEGEAVGELGNRILSLYDRGVTFPLGYSNGCQVYLPTTRMLPEHGYEVDSFWEYHWPSPLAAGCEEPCFAELARRQQSGYPNEAAGG